jgi:hypothetical protein
LKFLKIFWKNFWNPPRTLHSWIYLNVAIAFHLPRAIYFLCNCLCQCWSSPNVLCPWCLEFFSSYFLRSSRCSRSWLSQCFLPFFLGFLESIGMTALRAMISLLTIPISSIEQSFKCSAIHEYSFIIRAIRAVRSSFFSEALHNPCCNATRLFLVFIREFCIGLYIYEIIPILRSF